MPAPSPPGRTGRCGTQRWATAPCWRHCGGTTGAAGAEASESRTHLQPTFLACVSAPASSGVTHPTVGTDVLVTPTQGRRAEAGAGVGRAVKKVSVTVAVVTRDSASRQCPPAGTYHLCAAAAWTRGCAGRAGGQRRRGSRQPGAGRSEQQDGPLRRASQCTCWSQALPRTASACDTGLRRPGETCKSAPRGRLYLLATAANSVFLHCSRRVYTSPTCDAGRCTHLGRSAPG